MRGEFVSPSRLNVNERPLLCEPVKATRGMIALMRQHSKRQQRNKLASQPPRQNKKDEITMAVTTPMEAWRASK